MNEASPSFKPTILVAPLDWGLGHASRCIPIIHRLCTCGCRVVLAGEGLSQVILRSEFPQLPFLPLKGYRIRYTRNQATMFLSIAAQVPKMLQAIRAEQDWLQEVVPQHHINAIISDNRYGLYHSGIPSVIVTHQLQVRTGMGSMADRMLRKLHYTKLSRFQEIWVPDVPEGPQLAGTLSHPSTMPEVPVKYIGPLSRFAADANAVLPHYVLILLSGPEPQRSILENRLLQQADDFKKPVLFVRGLPGETSIPPAPYHVTVVNHLPTQTLQKAIASAAYVVARSGYSTVMEMLVLQKKCILIPTPGQTEQAYLARYLMQTQQALSLPQHKFQLGSAVALAAAFPYRLFDYKNASGLNAAVTELLRKIT